MRLTEAAVIVVMVDPHQIAVLVGVVEAFILGRAAAAVAVAVTPSLTWDLFSREALLPRRQEVEPMVIDRPVAVAAAVGSLKITLAH